MIRDVWALLVVFLSCSVAGLISAGAPLLVVLGAFAVDSLVFVVGFYVELYGLARLWFERRR